jgi:hypothetical protein
MNKMMNKKDTQILVETGLRNITSLAKKYKKAKIYHHQDLDGVISGLCMKEYLAQHGIKTVDAEVTQYGEKEWAIKTVKDETIMPVLVDFANSKLMFVIHTDHHDRQIVVSDDASTSFKHARSNAETLSQIVSPRDIFTNEDILLISTVDSANFASQDISFDDVINYVFKIDKDKSLQRNKMLMGFVCNKLILAFKNKPGFLEELVMRCKPSLLNILLTIKEIMMEKGWANVETLQKNKDKYLEDMKNHPNVKVMGNIIVQYGGGNMMKPGSYDRYTPFRNNPEADFLVIAWPMGLVQASCNPFKKERSMKGVDLGEIGREVMSKWEGQLKEKQIPLSTIKWVSETAVTPESVGFTFRDFVAIYGEKFKSMNNGREFLTIIGDIMNKPYPSLSEKQKAILEKITVSAWDVIMTNSGGHRCIYNSALQYVGRSTQKPQGRGGNSGEDSPLVKFTKMVQNEFVRVLQEKINNEK